MAFVRAPIGALARLTAILARPDAERRSYWRKVAGGKHWALMLITRGRAGEPPERPERGPQIRLNPEWLARTGKDLSGEDLLHLRILEELRAHTQDQYPLGAAEAASAAVTAVKRTLAEAGISIASLTASESVPWDVWQAEGES